MAEIQLSPQENGQDDWPRLKILADIYAYKATIVLRSGLWICRSKQNLPSGTHIKGSAGVRIKQELTHTGTDPFNAAFSSSPKFAPQPVEGRLIEQPDPYGRFILCDTAFQPGEFLRIWRGNHGLLTHYFEAVSIEGAGPYKIYLSRSLGAQFKTGDLVQGVASIPRDITIEGNGMRISGTGDRYVEIAAGLQCLVSDLHADTQHGGLSDDSPAMSFDIGGNYCSFVDCSVESEAFLINDGIIVESGYECTIKRCRTSHTGVTGLGLYDCAQCSIIDCSASHAAYGGYIGLDGTGEGCRHCMIKGGTFTFCQHGIHVGASYSSVITCLSCHRNYESGIKISTNEIGCSISEVNLSENIQARLIVQPGCQCFINNVKMLS